LSPALVEEIDRTVSPLLDDPSIEALVLASAKRDTFIAGADLEILDGMTRPEEPAALSRDGNALLGRLADSPKPVVAAVHGAALGGGMEVALACDYILASDDPATVFAQAEVMLGLIPAGGGTQRLVRRIGLSAALPLLLTGQRIRARKAYRLGLVDALTTPGGIAETGVRAALALAAGTLRPRRRKPSFLDRAVALPPVRAMVLSTARKQVQRQTRGLYPAPFAILECVETGLKHGLARGLECEARHFGELVISPQSRALRWIFFATNEAKKQAHPVPPRPVRRLAILGAGFMGSGIASVSLGRCPVVVRDISDAALSAAARSVERGLVKQVRSGAIRKIEADRRRSRLHLTLEMEEIARADLVVEAVFEELELKRKVLAEAEEVLSPEAVFASNTSALPIARIAAQARHPERVLGMHYFSPVPKMPLLEIVVAERTSPEALATARAFGVAQGKTPIAVKDGPGFYTTRILAPYLNEAMLLLEEGASIELIDRAMKDFGFPVGPMALLDEVGIDVGAHVALDLGAVFADRGLGASRVLPLLYEKGFKGRKNGKGFYVYPAKGAKGRKQPNPEIHRILGSVPRDAIPAETIAERLSLVMVNEAAHCLGEDVLASPRDGDLGAVLGLGFPPFRGGPFHHVDASGIGATVDRLQALAESLGRRFEPAPALADLGRTGGRFFP
ncbi:MAG TPA: hypothetical protein ENK19_07570, partial [Acidobacteria bacterium]|nr:hypothetical protein [Acidobacteriota bacterium]